MVTVNTPPRCNANSLDLTRTFMSREPRASNDGELSSELGKYEVYNFLVSLSRPSIAQGFTRTNKGIIPDWWSRPIG